MADNLDILNAAVSLLIKAAVLAPRFSGRVRQRYLKYSARRDVDAKATETLSLGDWTYHPVEPRLDFVHVLVSSANNILRYLGGRCSWP